jgi:hypothetical protein
MAGKNNRVCVVTKSDGSAIGNTQRSLLCDNVGVHISTKEQAPEEIGKKVVGALPSRDSSSRRVRVGGLDPTSRQHFEIWTHDSLNAAPTRVVDEPPQLESLSRAA